MENILLIDHSLATQKAITEIMSDSNCNVMCAVDATTAINLASEITPDLIIIELSLGGHSGMEFIYEFRTYSDWKNIPIIIYSTIRLEPAILKSRTWQNLNVGEYLYKPESTLARLKSSIEKLTNTLSNA